MSRVRPIRSLALACAATLVGVSMVATAGPAAATPAPTVDGPAPQSGPTAGGNPVRIYGKDFTGATAVKFGTTSATFVVIDDTLITAVVPSGGTNNTAVDVSVTTPNGTGTETGGFYYTNASLTLSAYSGFHPGDNVTVTLSGYGATTSVIVPEFNPLQLYLQGGPAFPAGPPPYAQVLGSQQTTSGSGGLTYTQPLPNPFTGTSGSSYDANIACPVNQTTADYLGNSASVGLNKPALAGKCYVGVGQFGAGTLERQISYTTDPTPASPTLTTDKSTASVGDTVTIPGGTASVNWNANPFFGSSTAHTNPGETAVTVQICGIGGNSATCSTTSGTGAVAMTRYITTSTTTPITGVLSGATASGTIVVGSDARGCTTCFVKVTQSRPFSNSISATRALTVNP